MDRKAMEDVFLKSNLENLFVKNGASVESPQVIGAIVTSAGAMALQSEKVSREDTIAELLDLYGKTDDEEVNQLVGMGPQYVSKLIGFSVNFNDYGNASLEYQQRKSQYDDIYNCHKINVPM